MARIQFGAFAIDSTTGELWRDGEPVPIQDLPLRLLLILLERPGEIVTRDELRQRLWSDTVIDFDGGLNTAVRKLRSALGDSADAPTLLETIPRRGYRLRAAIARTQGAEIVALSAARGRSVTHWLSLASVFIVVPILWLTLTAGQPTPRLLVVPFQADAATQFVADELTDELIGHVGRLAPDRLEVLGPMTARRHRDANGALDVARDLRVTHVLTGRLLRDADRLRVTVTLARASDGVQVWSDILEPPPGPLPQTTARVVTSIARTLGRQFDLRDDGVHARAGTLNSDAFDAYARGRGAWYRFDGAGFRDSLAHFHDAIGRDPGFSDAHVGAADAANMLALSGVPDGVSLLRDAAAEARAALAIDPGAAAAHAALGTALLYSLDDWPAAQAAFDRALALDPGSALFHQWAAGLASARGDHVRAIALAQRAQHLDPVSPWVNVDLCWYYFYGGQFTRAVAQSARAARMTRGPSPLFCRELALRQIGDEAGEIEAYIQQLWRASASPDAAIAEVEAARAQAGVVGVRRFRLARLLAGQAVGTPVNRYVLAATAAALGDTTVALAAMRDARARRAGWSAFLGVDPSFEKIRSEPEFRQLAR